MEEGNIVEHRNYLFDEEEKRKRAHAVRTAISGPLLRWVSRRETISVPVEAQSPPVGGNGASSSVPRGSGAESAPLHPINGVDASLPAYSPKPRTEMYQRTT
ncbi:hypothetical protein BJV78DRAFT_264960 [Lactifluus subvellereus]|nr:hypothetical protein BJV78DRAFT_264960 [Lactifluus subvellereus]